MRFIRKKQVDTPRRRASVNGVVVGDKRPASVDVFKRNRTLTGTTSNRFNAAGSNADLESTRSHAHRLSLHRRKITSVLLMTLIVSGFIWLLLSHLTAAVTITVNDSASIKKPVDKAVYEKAIQDYLGTDPLGRLTFFLDQSALTTYLANRLPEVQTVAQRGMDGLGGTNFAITMRTPVAGWQINKRQYFVDASGKPFEKNYYLDPTVQIVDNSGVVVKNDATAIASRRFLSFVGKVVHQSGQNGYIVTQASLPSGTTRELEIKIRGYSYPVKLSIDRPAGEQVEDMAAALRHLKFKNVDPSYVDVRVSGKAYYK